MTHVRNFTSYIVISPQFVRPFVKSNKNDFVDAEAICEAASRPSMRFVAPRTESQQEILALGLYHRDSLLVLAHFLYREFVQPDINNGSVTSLTILPNREAIHFP